MGLEIFDWLPYIIGPVIALSVGIPLFFWWRVSSGRRKNDELLRTGQPAVATVTRLWETGLRINNQPEIGFDLQVQPPQGAPFVAQAKVILSVIHLAQVQPGSQIQVRYDPQSPEQVAVVL